MSKAKGLIALTVSAALLISAIGLYLFISSLPAGYIAQAIGNLRAGAGSATGENPTDTPSISLAELDEINTAWTNQWPYAASYCDSPDEIQYLQGPDCFYGKYNGCIVLMRQTPMDFYEEQSVNGLIFKCPGVILWVCTDSTYYSLYSAYAEGLLTDEQLWEIWELHNKNIMVNA